MAFESTAPFWKAAPTKGRKSSYEDPAELLQDVCEYFQWCEDNPVYRAEVKVEDKILTDVSVPMRRVMTLNGLSIFLGITIPTIVSYRGDPRFKNIIAFAETTIKTQKFEGASVGQFSVPLMMRDLGMVDRSMIGNDPDNPMPENITIFQLPDNGRGGTEQN